MEWATGDGTVSFSGRVVHRYKTAGTYRATITVRSKLNPNLTAIREVIVGVVSITSFQWESYSAALAADARITNLINEGAFKVWPDLDSAQGKNRQVAKVAGRISPPVPNLPIYLRAFDVDDPSDDVAPVDPTPGNGGDNRGRFKSGRWLLTGGSMTAGNVPVEVRTDSQGRFEALFELTLQPGDNFRAVASLKESEAVSTVELATPATALGYRVRDSATCWLSIDRHVGAIPQHFRAHSMASPVARK